MNEEIKKIEELFRVPDQEIDRFLELIKEERI